MSRRVQLIASIFSIILVALFVVIARPHISRNAVQLFSESCTACGEFHDQVTGVVLLNPLRTRAPEIAATRFLSDLKQSKCEANIPEGICQHGLVNLRPVLDWKLRNRADSGDTVSLFYVVKGQYRSGVDIYPQDAWGEGIVKLEGSGSDWRIISYGAYY